MIFDDPEIERVFLEIHSGLPREAPGSQASTLKALDMARALPFAPKVLDIGCGPGAQTIDLAHALPDARIGAVDLLPGYVDEANRRFLAEGLEKRAKATLGDMTQLDFPDATFDLIWCEAAAYIMGVDQALKQWKRLLKSGGKLVFSEILWLTDTPSQDVWQYWQAYPAMANRQTIKRVIAAEGYTLLGDFLLPPEDWWDGYYTALGTRLKDLALTYQDDAKALSVIAASQAEIDLYRAHGDQYGYAFFIMKV